MPTKAVTNRQKNAEAVIAAGETNAALVATQLNASTKRYLPKGSPATDFETVVNVLTDLLKTARDEMVVAEEAHERELGDDVEPRRIRDDATADLASYLVELREIALGLYGAASLDKLGFLGTVTRDPIVLERYAGEICQSFGSVKTLNSRVKGAKWDRDEVSAAIDEKRAKLKAALTTVARESREAQASLAQKDAAIAHFDQVYGGVAETLSGLLRLSGNAVLADKLWPTARSPAKSADESPENNDGQPPEVGQVP